MPVFAVILGFLAMAAAACGTTVTETPVAVSVVDVTPGPLTLNVGQTAQLNATPKSAAGASLSARPVEWSSADQSVASVSTSGLVTGVKAGNTVITATSGGVHKDVAVTVVVPVTALAFAVQPANTVAGAPLAPAVVVNLLDESGNVAPSDAEVTLTLTDGATGALLGGATSAAAVNGVATFANLSITQKGAGYHLVASITGLQATSAAFNIAAGPAATITKLAGDAQTAVAGTPLPTAPAVKVTDVFGNTVSGATITFAPASGSGSVTGGTPQTDANGTATVGSWTVGGTMGPNTLTASVGSLTSTFTATVTGSATPGIYVVVGALGSASTRSAAVGQDIAVPLTLDLTNRGADDLASISLTINWDPTLMTLKSETAGNWTDSQSSGASVTINTADAATGVIRIAGFTASETLTSFVLRNFVFTTAAGSAGRSDDLTATVTAAGNASGSSITLASRPLTVTVTP